MVNLNAFLICVLVNNLITVLMYVFNLTIKLKIYLALLDEFQTI